MKLTKSLLAKAIAKAKVPAKTTIFKIGKFVNLDKANNITLQSTIVMANISAVFSFVQATKEEGIKMAPSRPLKSKK